MTDELAGLLRQAAEKYTNKFTTDGPEPSIVWIACSGLSGVFIGRLDEIDNFTLDHMDAIAGAVGMFFTVEYGHVEDLWRYRAYIDKMHCRRSDWRYADKRRASIAALCAILKYKLENP